MMKNIIKQIEAANNNTNRFALGKFDFRPTSILNKTLISDTSIVDEGTIIDAISDLINDKNNDKFYIEHKPGSNYFTLRIENGR